MILVSFCKTNSMKKGYFIIILSFLIIQSCHMEAQDKNLNNNTQNIEFATFGAGCFWGVEATFQQVPGVIETAVGYSGGYTQSPSYREVCADKTGHAEVVHIKFNPQKTNYAKLLTIFWDTHDPTQLNRQGPDIGSQYRSAIFYHNEHQKQIALKSKQNLQKSGKYKKDIVTQIEPFQAFYKAEDYHQKYLEKRGLNNCSIR